MKSRLREKYENEIRPALKERFGSRNDLAVARLAKISINMGAGRKIIEEGGQTGSKESRTLSQILSDLALITGQKAVPVKAKRSVANFKVRQGFLIGCRVTLRGERMYEFFDRLVNVAMPRLRDFRGVPATSFDGRGNLSLGVPEQTVFPEIDPDKSPAAQGMDITIVTTAETDEEARELLSRLGMPFRD